MMKYFTHTNAGKLKLNFRAKMNLLTTGLIFVLLLLSTFLGNGVMILLIHHGFINAGPPSSQIPLLIQTGIISILIGTLDHTFDQPPATQTSPYIGRGYSSSIHRKL